MFRLREGPPATPREDMVRIYSAFCECTFGGIATARRRPKVHHATPKQTTHCLKKQNPIWVTQWDSAFSFSTASGTWTRTAITGQRILSPSCLPIPPSRLEIGCKGSVFLRTDQIFKRLFSIFCTAIVHCKSTKPASTYWISVSYKENSRATIWYCKLFTTSKFWYFFRDWHTLLLTLFTVKNNFW